MENILSALDKPWSYEYLSDHPNITWLDVSTNPQLDWDYDGLLSRNPHITWSIVRENPGIPWNYTELSSNLMSKHPCFTKQMSYVLK
jgi:hypothetical protein